MQLTPSFFISYITVLTTVLLVKRGRRIPHFLSFFFFFGMSFWSRLICFCLSDEKGICSCTLYIPWDTGKCIHSTRNISRRQGENLYITCNHHDEENLLLQMLVQLARVKLILLQTKSGCDRKCIYLNCCTMEISIAFKSQLREKWLT